MSKKSINPNSYDQSLRDAMKHNWEHIRHEETQRGYLLYVYALMLSGVLSFTFSNHVAWHITLSKFWPVFFFLFIFSWVVSSSFLKWNIEVRNHLKANQWISEKLGLIKNISKKREEQVENSQIEKHKELLDDSFYQGYVGLGLPLPKRVHKDFKNLCSLMLFLTATIFVAGGLINAGQIFYDLIQVSTFEVFPFRLLAYVIGCTIGIMSFILNHRMHQVSEEKANKLLDIREPDEIKLRYRRKPSFYKD